MKKLAVVVLAAAVLAAVLAACASRQAGAPVSERTPTRGAPGRAPEAQAAPVPGAVPQGFYQVKRGDTLYSIALEHGADYRELAQWNFLEDPTKIRVGQLLRVTAPNDRPAVQVAPARGSGRVESKPLESPQQAASAPAEPAKLAKPDAPKQAAEPSKQPPEAAAEFIWPVKGKVIAGFSEPRSKGIDIDGKLGEPVVAAAAGRVTYIGSGIPGLGKLVVIKHDNGFITVYAHNREILVKEQQTVARGQRIAELGSTDSDRPKLHFQIRKGASPVDPLRYLPGS
ncbi:MAG TPA: peptidoglycan DD-metalloendopeptidase family protein [Burkholderiales bacterium]|nr:peptidoglycan DD-metalloendopeptidase family protein [Burkholderiales bacterium]